MKTLSIVIPAYNEEESLPHLVDKIKAVMKENSYTYEIIFINDGSTDKSSEVLRDIILKNEFIKMIDFRKNFGKSCALDIGFRECKNDIVITMDADLQDDPKEIPRMIEKLDEGYDLVSGWKKKRNDPIHKTLPSKLFNFVTSKVAGIKLHDFNCGFKAYKKDVVKNISVYGEMHRYIPALAFWKGFKVTEISVEHHARKYGKSKFGMERFLRGLLDFLTVFFITRYKARPMHFFGKWGMLSFVIGLLIEVYLTIEWIIYMVTDKGTGLSDRPLLLLGILLMVLGMMLLSTGFISEMIVYFNREDNKSKNEDYAVKEIVENKKDE